MAFGSRGKRGARRATMIEAPGGAEGRRTGLPRAVAFVRKPTPPHPR
jgi:hypothetical protein